MSLLNKLIKSRETLIEMLNLRNYNFNKYSNSTEVELDLMLKSMDKKMNIEMTPLDMMDEIDSKKCVVKYILTKTRFSNLNTFIMELIENEVVKSGDDLIFVVVDKINNLELFYNMCDEIYNSDNIFIQIFLLDNLQVNISNHELVPDLKILSVEEKEVVKKKYNVKSMTEFPLILKFDPMAKFFGVKNGDLCEITRVSETSGIYKSYRYCE